MTTRDDGAGFASQRRVDAGSLRVISDWTEDTKTSESAEPVSRGSTASMHRCMSRLLLRWRSGDSVAQAAEMVGRPCGPVGPRVVSCAYAVPIVRAPAPTVLRVMQVVMVEVVSTVGELGSVELALRRQDGYGVLEVLGSPAAARAGVGDANTTELARTLVDAFDGQFERSADGLRFRVAFPIAERD